MLDLKKNNWIKIKNINQKRELKKREKLRVTDSWNWHGSMDGIAREVERPVKGPRENRRYMNV